MPMRFDAAFELFSEPNGRERSVVITNARDPDHPILFASDEFTVQTGYSAAEAIGRNCRFLQGPDTDRAARRLICTALARARPISIDIVNYRKDGASYWNRVRIRPLLDDHNSLRYFVALLNPIGETEVRPLPR